MLQSEAEEIDGLTWIDVSSISLALLAAESAVYLKPFSTSTRQESAARNAALRSIPSAGSPGAVLRALRAYFGSLDPDAQLRCGVCDRIMLAGVELSEDAVCASCMDACGFPVETPECLRCGDDPHYASLVWLWKYHADWTGEGHPAWLCPNCEEWMQG